MEHDDDDWSNDGEEIRAQAEALPAKLRAHPEYLAIASAPTMFVGKWAIWLTSNRVDSA